MLDTPVAPLEARPRMVTTTDYRKTTDYQAWDDTATMVSDSEDSVVSFDKLLQEMFQNDQQIHFEDLLELASM